MRRLSLILVALGGAAAAAAWYWPSGSRPREVRLPGTVEVQEVRLGSKLGGRVAAVAVREGQVVEPGAVLLTFEPHEWEVENEKAMQKLAAARADLDKANRGPLDEEVAEARAAADAAAARYARTTAGYREEQKRQAAADRDAARADRTRTEADHARLHRTPDAVSQADRDAATAARDAARERLKAAEAALDQATRGNRAEDIDEAKAELARLTARYQFVRRGTRDEDKANAYAAMRGAEAELAAAAADLQECTLLAPERCVVQTLSVRAGSLVPAGQPVVVVHRADDLWVKVFVPAADLGRVRVGQAVTVGVDSHPGTRFDGRVTHIAASSEYTPRNVQSADERQHQVFAVKVRVTDPQGVFKSGMAAEVFVTLDGGN